MLDKFPQFGTIKGMENGYIRPRRREGIVYGWTEKAYYRTYQQVFDIGMRCLHWRKPIVISGAGAIRHGPGRG